jgi:hypothetical protein
VGQSTAEREHNDYRDYDPWTAAEQGFYDDDPNPYHGDYSEM